MDGTSLRLQIESCINYTALLPLFSSLSTETLHSSTLIVATETVKCPTLNKTGIMTDKYISPRLIPLPAPITKISSGCHHILFLAETGQVFSMGCGENGQLGRLSERFATRNARNWKQELMTPALVPLKYAFKKGTKRSWSFHCASGSEFYEMNG